MTKQPLKKSLDKVVALIKRRKNRDFPKPELATGFDRVDDCFRKGSLTLLSGTPGVGKTSLALNIVGNLAIREHKSVAYISLEIPEEQIIERMIYSETGIDGWKIRVSICLPEEEMSQMDKMTKEMSKAPIFIEDIVSPSVNDIGNIAKRLHKKHKIKLLIIDHLLLISTKGGHNPKRTTKITEGIKKLAVKLNIPIILIVPIYKAKSRFQMIRKLRKIGNLGKFSDALLLLNKRKDEGDPNYPGGLTDILIEKNDNGYTGTIATYFNSSINRFSLPTYKTDAVGPDEVPPAPAEEISGLYYFLD